MTLNIGTAFITLSSTWAEIKTVCATQNLQLRSREKDSDLHIFVVDNPVVYLCTLYRGPVPHAIASSRFPNAVDSDEALSLAQAANDADVADFDDNYASTANGALTARAPDGALIQQVTPREGSKTQIVSQNFCDKHTWYSTSARRVAQALTDSGDGLTWALADPKVGVDVTHGRILHERKLRAEHKPVVRVDGVAKVEKDPHDNAGDYTINYATMSVTFASSQAGAVVTIDFSEVVNSKWYLRPLAGKKLRLLSAELQFSVDARMDDSFIFQGRGDVAKFWALAGYWNANGGPYPAGTMLPLGDPTVYQTVNDLICESSRAYPAVPASKHDTPTWRDALTDTHIFSWDYDRQATVDVTDGIVASPGQDPNEIEISLEHDVEMVGSLAVVTFYCISEDT